MSAPIHGLRSMVASLAVLAVVFAPATHEGLVEAPEILVDDVQARILAPTVREAVVAVGPRLSPVQVQATRQGTRPGSLPSDVPAAAGLLLLLSLAWAARSRSVDGIRSLQEPLSRIPRGPPGLQTA